MSGIIATQRVSTESRVLTQTRSRGIRWYFQDHKKRFARLEHIPVYFMPHLRNTFLSRESNRFGRLYKSENTLFM